LNNFAPEHRVKRS